MKARDKQNTQGLFSSRGFDFKGPTHDNFSKYFFNKTEQKLRGHRHQLLAQNCFGLHTSIFSPNLGPICFSSSLITATTVYLPYGKHCTKHLTFIILFNIYNTSIV